MVGLIIAIVVAGALAWLLFGVALPQADSLKKIGPIYLMAGFLALVLFFVAMMAFNRAAQLEEAATLEPLSSEADLLAHKDDRQVLVTGRVSSEMSPALDDYVAYVDLDEGGMDWLPALIVELEDQQLVDVSAGYEPDNWQDDGDYLVLRVGDVVAIRGELFGTATSLFADEADRGVGINAGLVYRGSFDGYVSDYLPGENWQVTLGLFLAALALFLAALMLIIPLPKVYSLWPEQGVKIENQ